MIFEISQTPVFIHFARLPACPFCPLATATPNLRNQYLKLVCGLLAIPTILSLSLSPQVHPPENLEIFPFADLFHEMKKKKKKRSGKNKIKIAGEKRERLLLYLF